MELSVGEVRRFVQAISQSQEQQAHRLHWSRFRRQHQARAQRFHRLRRARQAPAVSLDLPPPLRLRGVPALTDEHWEQIRPLLPPQKPTGRPAVEHRLMLEAMLWVVRDFLILARIARALRAVVDGGQPLPTLVPRGPVGADLAGLASL